jgi:exodeoxyribonuclease X
MKPLLIDTETTGLKEPDIIEVAHVFLPETLEEFRAIDHTTLCWIYSQDLFARRYRPNKAIDPGASKIHGIYMKDLLRCARSSTFKLPECSYLVGHNVQFDHRALRKPNVDLICTLKLARISLDKKKHHIRNHKLTTLVEYFGHDSLFHNLQGAHTAVEDVIFTYLVLASLCEINPHWETWEDLFQFSK